MKAFIVQAGFRLHIEPLPGRAALPRCPDIPLRAQSAKRKEWAAQQRRPTSRLKMKNLKRLCVLLSFCSLSLQLYAYPPAPHHGIYGLVRDEFGNPLRSQDAQVMFETTAGVKFSTPVEPGREPGVNYRLDVPMDSGMTSDLYKPTALRPTVPFVMRVKIGTVTYLPIELSGDLSKVGQAGKETILNLTLGEDADGDGLPDAWERSLMLSLGLDSLGDVNGGDDSDGDGLSNLDEYISGNYAYDDEDGFALEAAGVNGDSPVLQFRVLRGRSYTVYGTDDLKSWVPVVFRVTEDGESRDYETYQSDDVKDLQVEVVALDGQPIPRFFKLQVQ